MADEIKQPEVDGKDEKPEVDENKKPNMGWVGEIRQARQAKKPEVRRTGSFLSGVLPLTPKMFALLYIPTLLIYSVLYELSYFFFSLITGIIVILVGFTVFAVVSILLIKALDTAILFKCAVLRITAALTIIVMGIIATVHISTASMSIRDINLATETAVATVKDITGSSGNMALVLEFKDESGLQHRASLSISSVDALYVAGDKVKIRYSPLDYKKVIAAHITANCPLDWLDTNKRNPEILQGDKL